MVEPGSRRGTYRLGLKLLRLGSAVVARFDERQAALPVMERLHEETEETVFLCIRRGYEAVCIERIDGRWVQSMALRLGGSLPLHVGAAPRALLAFEPRDFWEEYVRRVELRPFTRRTPVSKTALFRALEEVSADGYSISDGDVVAGMAAVGCADLRPPRESVRRPLDERSAAGDPRRQRSHELCADSRRRRERLPGARLCRRAGLRTLIDDPARGRHALLAPAPRERRHHARAGAGGGGRAGRRVRPGQPPPRAGAGSRRPSPRFGSSPKAVGLLLLASGDFLGEGRNGDAAGSRRRADRGLAGAGRRARQPDPARRLGLLPCRAARAARSYRGRAPLRRRGASPRRSARGRRRGDASAREPLRLHRRRVPRRSWRRSGRARSASSST